MGSGVPGKRLSQYAQLLASVHVGGAKTVKMRRAFTSSVCCISWFIHGFGETVAACFPLPYERDMKAQGYVRNFILNYSKIRHC
jgi:hypothetical protein